MTAPVPSLLEHRPPSALRGRRLYVHSTDLYADILAGAEALFGGPCDGALSLTLRTTFDRAPRILYRAHTRDAAGIADAVVEFSLGVAQQRVDGWVVADGPQVTARKSYDEQPIWSAAVHDGDSVTLAHDPGAAPIEVLTALGVALLNRRLPPPTGRKWLLGRLQLGRPLRDSDSAALRLSLRANAKGDVARLNVAVGDEALGAMMFLLGSGVPTAGATR